MDPKNDMIKVIGVVDKSLYTEKLIVKAKVNDKKQVVSDTDQDTLKIVIVNRYFQTRPAVAFIKGYNMKSGAIAVSVSHDSHNITCVGVSDSDIVRAINLVISTQGGASATANGKDLLLPLPIAGLMSVLTAKETADRYKELQDFAKFLGCKLESPFPTLTFMALTVIPELKVSDKGLFDVALRKLVSVYQGDN